MNWNCDAFLLRLRSSYLGQSQPFLPFLINKLEIKLEEENMKLANK